MSSSSDTPTIHNLMGKEPNHANMCYDPHSVQCVIGIDLADGDDGHVHGSTFIPGDRFAMMMGQSDPDTVRLSTVTAEGVVTPFNGSMGAHVHYGERDGADTELPIGTVDRVMHVVPADDGRGRIITTHFPIPPAAKPGENSSHFPPNGLGKISIASSFNTKDESQVSTARSFQRKLRWNHALNKTPEELASSCVKVGTADTARYLIPLDANADACAMSTLIRSNVDKNGAEFCSGNYTPAKRTTVVNARGENCTVMAGRDFQQVFSQLHDNLKPKDPIAKGFTARVKSFEPGTVGLGKQQLQLHVKFDRQTTADVMDCAHTPIIDKMAAMSMLGETPDASFSSQTNPMGPGDPLAHRVFAGGPLPGEDLTIADMGAAASAAQVTPVNAEDSSHIGSAI